jgi:hypothetical protein
MQWKNVKSYMYKIVPWSEDLDLTEFYAEAEQRGFANNATQKVMIDCFRKESTWAGWILYQDDKAVGSVVAHSFPEMGKDAYRVLARTCTFGTARQNGGLITPKRLIAEHQNLTDQFLLPTCIEWTPPWSDLYATSNEGAAASQRLVHKHYFPTLEKLGIVERVKEMTYRNTDQTVWKIRADKFLENLERYPRWV